MEKIVSNRLNTVYKRSPDILLRSCCDNALSLSSTKHMQVYFVLCKQCLQVCILEFDTLFFLCTLDGILYKCMCTGTTSETKQDSVNVEDKKTGIIICVNL